MNYVDFPALPLFLKEWDHPTRTEIWYSKHKQMILQDLSVEKKMFLGN